MNSKILYSILIIQGKIARSWCKRAYLSNPIGLEIVYRWDASIGADSEVENENVNNAVPAGGQEVEMVPSSGANKADYARVAEEEDGDGVRDPETIRAMSAAELQQELEVILCDLVGRVGGELTRPVDPQKPLVLLGMDSMSVIQFKGVLDNRYNEATCAPINVTVVNDVVVYTCRYKCNIPDEYMFTTLASLDSLVNAVKHGTIYLLCRYLHHGILTFFSIGGLTEQQLEDFAASEGPQQGDTGDQGERVVPVVERSSEPWCPWFTCCY